MEENSDEIKLETMELDGFMEEINDIAPVYVQEGFMSDSEEEPRTRQGSRMPKPFEMEMKNMKRRVRDLESEVGALRSELRLVKRKFREVVDPSQDRYREVIQQVVAETLDNQCYWKTIRFDPRVSGANAKRKSLDSNHSPQRRKSFKGNSSDSIGDSDEYRRIDTDDDEEIARKQQQRNPGARKDTQSWRILHGAQSANKNPTGPQKPDLKYREDPKKLKSGESKQLPKNIESKVVVVRKETGNTGGTTGRDVPAKDNWQGKNSGTKRGSGGGDEPNSSVDRSHQHVRKIEKEDESDGDMDGTHQHDRKNSYSKDPDFKIKMKWDKQKKMRLIRLVRQRPLLWDPADECYSKKHLRDGEWETIAEILGGTSREAVKSHWRVLRVCFGSEKRKTERPNSIRHGIPSKWMFYKELMFLDPVLTSANAQRQSGLDLEAFYEGAREVENSSEEKLNLPEQEDPTASVRSWINYLPQSSVTDDEEEDNATGSSRSHRSRKTSFVPIFGTSLSSPQ